MNTSFILFQNDSRHLTLHADLLVSLKNGDEMGDPGLSTGRSRMGPVEESGVMGLLRLQS